MALEEVSFYNTNGDEIFLSNIVNQMINYYDLKLEVGETQVTDFNEGSEIRNLLEAFAVGIYALLEEQHEATRIAFIHSSYGSWLDRLGELPFINLPRIEAENSIGTVTFTLATAQENEFVIPEGTIVRCSSNDIDFVTAYDSSIVAGDLSVDVAVECTIDGVIGNVGSGEIDTVINDELNTDLISVTNNEAFTNGTDYEDDDFYRQRLLDNVQQDGFGTIGYYKRLGEDISGVHDVKLVDEINYTKKVLVNGDVKPCPDGTVLDVLTEFSNLDNIVLGHKFIAGACSCTDFSLTINVNVTQEFTDERLETAIRKLVDGGNAMSVSYTGLFIDEVLTKERIEEVLNAFLGVVNVTSIKDGNNNDVSSIVPDTDTVLRLVNLTINQTVV